MDNQLRVWWIRNVPGEAEYHAVGSEAEAVETIERLALADLRDPSVSTNAMGLEEFEGGDWHVYYNEKGDGIDAIIEELGGKDRVDAALTKG